MDKIKCIYAIKDKRSDKVIYIGQTKDFNHRKSCHFNDDKSIIDSFIFQEGREHFEMFLIEKLLDDITNEEIHSKEEKYILEYGTLFNGFNKIHAINEKRKNPNEYLKQWRAENKELCSSYNKNYYEQNKDKFEKYREKRKEY